jgi:hypothetical protein
MQEGARGRDAVRVLHENRVAVVLATTLDLDNEFDVDRQLGLNELPCLLHEDLDRFTRAEAAEYLARTLGPSKLAEAEKALDHMQRPGDDSLVDPFYLNLIVELTSSHALPELPGRQTDKWRARILNAYVNQLKDDKLPRREGTRPVNPARAQRNQGPAVYEVAVRVAKSLELEQNLEVKKRRLKNVNEDVFEDADRLNVLRNGCKIVSFTSDDMGAYMVAACEHSQEGLLGHVLNLVGNTDVRTRHERFALMALTFWYLQREGQDRRVPFDSLLEALETVGSLRPRAAAAVIRILCACDELRPFEDRVAGIAELCVATLDRKTGWAHLASDPTALHRLVRALQGWDKPVAHRLLWRLATSRNVDVVWPAVNGLATAAGSVVDDLKPEIDRVIGEAESKPLHKLSEEGNELGNELASLAWVLPTLCSNGVGNGLQRRWQRVHERCLDPAMSPLRGEMAVAQGLKLAVLNGRYENLADVRRLLCETPLRFWHARLVFVQALFAYAYENPNQLDEFRQRFIALYRTEPHPLTRRAIGLALQGLRALDESSTSAEARALRYEFMWTHEHDAVTRVEQQRWKVSRLAADVVLLSNMIYRRWMENVADDRESSTGVTLPLCILDGSKRQVIIGESQIGCKCGYGLCTNPQPPAFAGTWAKFSERFCCEQARLAAQYGRPSWTNREMPVFRTPGGFRKPGYIARYWRDQAAEIATAKKRTCASKASTSRVRPELTR